MNFQNDKTTWSIDEQMMWGNGLLISPVLAPGQTTVSAYFPAGSRWYDYYDGGEIVPGYRTLSAPLNSINLHLRGGEIIPIQSPAMTTMDSRTNGLGLIVSLDDKQEARGNLYWDEGNSIDPIKNGKFTFLNFKYSNFYLTSGMTHCL